MATTTAARTPPSPQRGTTSRTMKTGTIPSPTPAGTAAAAAATSPHLTFDDEFPHDGHDLVDESRNSNFPPPPNHRTAPRKRTTSSSQSNSIYSSFTADADDDEYDGEEEEEEGGGYDSGDEGGYNESFEAIDEYDEPLNNAYNNFSRSNKVRFVQAAAALGGAAAAATTPTAATGGDQGSADAAADKVTLPILDTAKKANNKAKGHFDLCSSLHKRRGGFGRNAEHNWVQRCFTLYGPILCYHDAPTIDRVSDPSRPRGRLNLVKEDTIAEMHSKHKPGAPTEFLLTVNIYVLGGKRKWEMCCSNRDQQVLWYDAIRRFDGRPIEDKEKGGGGDHHRERDGGVVVAGLALGGDDPRTGGGGGGGIASMPVGGGGGGGGDALSPRRRHTVAADATLSPGTGGAAAGGDGGGGVVGSGGGGNDKAGGGGGGEKGGGGGPVVRLPRRRKRETMDEILTARTTRSPRPSLEDAEQQAAAQKSAEAAAAAARIGTEELAKLIQSVVPPPPSSMPSADDVRSPFFDGHVLLTLLSINCSAWFMWGAGGSNQEMFLCAWVMSNLSVVYLIMHLTGYRGGSFGAAAASFRKTTTTAAARRNKDAANKTAAAPRSADRGAGVGAAKRAAKPKRGQLKQQRQKSFTKAVAAGSTMPRATAKPGSSLANVLQQHGPLSAEAVRAYAAASKDSYDDSVSHTYWNLVASDFKLRIGPNYKKNKQKAPSAPALYDLVTMDFVKAETGLKNVSNGIRIPTIPGITDFDTGNPHVPPLFVCNLWLPAEEPSVFGKATDGPSYIIVLIFVLSDKTRRELKDLARASPAVRLLSEWCRRAEKEPDFRARFKILGQVEEIEKTGLPSFICAYNGKPAIVSKSGHFKRHPNYIEMRTNIHMWAYMAKKGVHILKPKFPNFVVNAGFTIEARCDEEMPEVLLGGVRAMRIDPAKARIDGSPDAATA